MTKGKYLALDFGDRRVGVAISDLDKMMAFPRDVLLYTDEAELIDSIKSLCDEESVVKIILGLPVEMDGKIGDRALKTYAFGDALKKAIPGISVEYFDERLSSRAAQRILSQSGIKAKVQRGKLDSTVAQFILQAYLQG